MKLKGFISEDKDVMPKFTRGGVWVYIHQTEKSAKESKKFWKAYDIKKKVYKTILDIDLQEVK